MMEHMKSKIPVFIMPVCLIAIVYFVDNVLFRMGSGKTPAGEATSGPSNSFFEMASIIVCVLLPAIYFNCKHKDGSEAAAAPKVKSLSETLRTVDEDPKQ